MLGLRNLQEKLENVHFWHLKKNHDLKLQVNDDDDYEEEAEVVRHETPRQEMPRRTRYV